MAIKILFRRAAGQRAGMDRPKILGAALALWLKNGPEDFSIRAIAVALKISPTTIHSHFKGGAEELKREIAREALANRAPPYKPGQGPEDYLRQLIRSLLAACRKEPHLGGLVAIGLSEGPLFSPAFAERICVTLAEIAKKLPLAVALHIVSTRLVGLIVMESSDWALLKPQTAKAKISAEISRLPEPDFSTLKLAGEKLAIISDRRAKPGYDDSVVGSAVDAIMWELRNARP